MSDDRMSGGPSNAGAPRSAEPSMGDLALLFAHSQQEERAAESALHDHVSMLFGASVVPSGVDGEAGRPAAALFAEPPEDLSSPYSGAGSAPLPIPAIHEPQHAAPGYGLSRPQRIAMGIGAVVTMLGAGWALAAPSMSEPATEAPSPVATVDPARAAKVDDGIDALASALQQAKSRAGSFAAPLAAMAGSSDEASRAAAETARQMFAAALAAVEVPAKTRVGDGNALLDQAQRDTAAGQDALVAGAAAFRAAIVAFTQSLPAYAAIAVAQDADADESFRTAATEAAAAVAASDPFGPTEVTTWDAWRAALSALHEDQARAAAAQSPLDSGGTDSGGAGAGGTDSGGTDSVGTTTPPTPPPTEPPPSDPPPSDPPSPPPVVVNPEPTVPPVG